MTGTQRPSASSQQSETDDTMREVVASALEELCCTNGPLDAYGPNRSALRFGGDSRRDAVLTGVLDEYLSMPGEYENQGRCVVVTAGPPGAGKSTEVAGLSLGCRVIDADAIKDLLISRALVDGTYDPLLEHVLPDGSPVLPRELAGLFHVESTVVAGDALKVCTQRHEDIIIEGTMRWDGLIDHYVRLLSEEDYRRLEILSCELPLLDAQARALTRWWEGRTTGADQGLGGRFVPRRHIDDLYPKTVDVSACRDNALRLFEVAKGQFDEVRLTMSDPGGREQFVHSAAV